jgi:hypothetical protein
MKSKRNIGLNLLEYRLESESEDDIIAILVLILIKEYQLPRLKPISSYEKIRYRNNKLAPRLLAVVKG